MCQNKKNTNDKINSITKEVVYQTKSLLKSRSQRLDWHNKIHAMHTVLQWHNYENVTELMAVRSPVKLDFLSSKYGPPYGYDAASSLAVHGSPWACWRPITRIGREYRSEISCGSAGGRAASEPGSEMPGETAVCWSSTLPPLPWLDSRCAEPFWVLAGTATSPSYFVSCWDGCSPGKR